MRVGREAADARRSASHTFPGYYTGPIWIRVGTSGTSGPGSAHVALSWGAKHDEETVDLSGGPVYFRTRKGGTDATPIGVSLDQATEVRFGRGNPPSSADVVDINGDWT